MATLFHVVARTQGGEIRGLSIVYSNRARNEIAGIAQSMLNSFEPFPGTVVATGQVDTRGVVLEQQLADVKRREQDLLRREEEERRKASAQSGANDRRIAELERQLSDNRQREEELKREEERRKSAGQSDTRIAELERQLAEIRRREIEIAKRDEEEKRKAKEDRERAAREDAIRKEEQEKASKERQKLLKELEARQEKSAGELKAVGLPPGKRVALVVGINSYESLTPLKTAVNDAMAISKTLETMGFSVVESVEVSWRGFYRKWQEFLNEIEGGGTAVFFFAGHGIQIDGANYLLPKDVSGDLMAEEMLRRESINFNELRKELQDRRPALSLFILDACRNNPFLGLPRAELGIRAALRGWTRPEAHS